MTNLKLKCEYMSKGEATANVTYIEGTQITGEKFVEGRKVEFATAALPDNINALCLAYGLRAVLADRTSDAKSLGVNKLDWMSDVYDMLAGGEWNKKKVANGGVDRAMVHLIVDLKKCTAIEAEAALKASTKEFKDAIKEKYADKLAAIRKDLSSAEAVDLTDL